METQSSEPALRDDYDIPGFHVDVRRDVSALEEILDADPVLSAPFTRRPQDGGVVAVGKVGDPADHDHDVEQSHILAVRQRLRPRRLAYDTDLLVVGADEGLHEDC